MDFGIHNEGLDDSHVFNELEELCIGFVVDCDTDCKKYVLKVFSASQFPKINKGCYLVYFKVIRKFKKIHNFVILTNKAINILCFQW